MKLFIISLVISLAASCNDKYPDIEDGMYAEIVTTKGTMMAKLAYDKVPVTVANFVSLAEGTNTLVDSTYAGKKYYNGLKFHRVIKDFMIQGGDPLGNGSGNPGYKFKDEFDASLKHDKKGILAMANSGYGTNGSQFYITHKETPWLDAFGQNGVLKPCEQPRVSCHAVFGEILTGLEIVDAIEQGDEIVEVNIIRKGSAAKDFDAEGIFKQHFIDAEKELKEKEAKQAELHLNTKRGFDELMRKAETTASGLQYVFTHKENGEKPKTGVNVKLNYAGYLAADGSLVDTSRKDIADKFNKTNDLMRMGQRFQSMQTSYSNEAQLIAGFKEGMQLMSVGDKITLFIPPHLAYGERGAGGGVIPPNATMIFELHLTEIVRKK